MCSMGSMATMPQPMSKKAPKDSRWVTTAVTTDAGAQVLQEEVHGPLLNGPAGEECRAARPFHRPGGPYT